MRCGQEVQIIDAWGSIAAIAVSQCGGGFRVIVHSTDWRDKHDAPFRNGEILSDWRMLLDRLVWLIGHAPDEPGYAYYLVIPVPVGESEGDHAERSGTPANAGERPDTGAALG